MRQGANSGSDWSAKGVPSALFVAAGVVQYVGAAIAISLFAVLTPPGVVWWRVAVGAFFLVLLWRPWKLAWSWPNLALALGFGGFLVIMNTLFYLALSTIPLGTAVSVEFLGPVTVAVLKGRGTRSRVAAGLALAGVVSISGWGLDLSSPAQLQGFLFALGAAAAWAIYILLGAQIARQGPTGGYLGVGMAFSAFVFLAVFGSAPFDFHLSLPMVASLLGVGILSSAIPYSLEALVFSRVSAATYGLLTALLPATSTLIGALMLQQLPSIAELLGLLLISGAVWLVNVEAVE